MAPTVLEFTGSATSIEMDGKSFAPLLRGDRYKYIYYHDVCDSFELYDLQTGPREQHNLIDVAAMQPLVNEMRNRLFDRLEAAGAVFVPIRRGGWQADERLLRPKITDRFPEFRMTAVRSELQEVEGDETRRTPHCILSRQRSSRRGPFAFTKLLLLRLALVGAVGANAGPLSAATAPPASAAASAPWQGARPAATLSAEDDAFLEELQRASFRFFEEQMHPRTGLVRDRARADGLPSEGMASIAASGFALSGWVIAVQRGWVDRATALERVRLMLRFLAREAPRRRGFFYHFMVPATGARAWECELSPIDTSLFLAGAIVAREYFGDPEITELANAIYTEIDWPWFLNDGPAIVGGWRDEYGFTRYRWSDFSEHMLMSLLAIGSPGRSLGADYWQDWKRSPLITYGGRNFLEAAPLFIHQFSHAYVDFRNRRDAFADYFRNSVLATLAHREFCIDLRSEFPRWSERLWGVTASDSPRGYRAWGGPPRSLEGGALDGTLVPCAAAGSLPFAPTETLETLRHMRTVFGDAIWRRYGFVDAFNPETGWVNRDVIGIDVGITLLQAENTRSGLMWALFMRAPEIKRALASAGFISTERRLPASQRETLRALASDLWRMLPPADSVAPEATGLRLTTVAAAHALGLTSTAETFAAARTLLRIDTLPSSDLGLAQYAAGLVTLRQAFPSLAADATRRLESIRWSELAPVSTELGAASRLAVFFQIAAGVRPPGAWTALRRTPTPRGPVFVLAPASVSDQLLPGLWLAEREIITGASAAQFAYAQAVAPRAVEAETPARDGLTLALLIEHFPAEAIAHLPEARRAAEDFVAASAADRATLFVAAANLLAGDCVRRWFQQDPLVRNGRAAIAEFGEAAFGPNTSVIARRELAGPRTEPPARTAVARPAHRPRGAWDWQRVAGLEYRYSVADVRPGDPALELRFAFTWDHAALRFHAEAVDTPPGYERPEKRRERVVLFIDPEKDGFDRNLARDHHLIYMSNGQAHDALRQQPVPAKIVRTDHGYTVEAEIPWTTLGLEPRPGLELSVTASVVIGGPKPHLPSLTLTWRYHANEDGLGELGTLRLEQ